MYFAAENYLTKINKYIILIYSREEISSDVLLLFDNLTGLETGPRVRKSCPEEVLCLMDFDGFLGINARNYPYV